MDYEDEDLITCPNCGKKMVFEDLIIICEYIQKCPFCDDEFNADELDA